MNRTNFYDNIRTITQSDSTDLPDTLLAIFVDEAWRHCAFWKQWPFYRQTWTYTLTGTGSLSTITVKQLIAGADNVAETAQPATPNSIEAVFDTTNDRKLAFVDNAEYDRLLRENPDNVGDPRCYTVEQGQWKNNTITNVGWHVDFTFKFWPIPSNAAVYALRFEGFREPISFVTTADGYSSGTVPGGYYSATPASAVPDMPTEFHEAILHYAIGQAFAYLDEGQRSMYYNAKCDNVLALQENRWFKGPTLDGPLVLNSGMRTGVYNQLPARLKYDFE